MKRGQLVRLIVICSIVVLFLSISGCIRNGNNNTNDPEEDWRDWPIDRSSGSKKGHCNEGESEIVEFDISEYYVTEIIIELTWKDEPNITKIKTYENQPDTFNITIFTPWNETINSDVVSNPIGGMGRINETIEIAEEDVANNTAIGEWLVNIHCVECGNFESQSGGVIGYTDNSNDWKLSYYYEYHSGEIEVRW